MKWIKTSAVVVGAVIITALGIDAADTLNGNSGTLLSQVMRTSDECPEGMVATAVVSGVSCVDAYEAAPGKNCPSQSPTNAPESEENIEHEGCTPISEEGKTPWRFVSREQAMRACALAGKRLPTSGEWYQLTLGIPDVENVCNVQGGSVARSGSNEKCVTPSGVYDTIGNVWEWVSDDVIEGVYENRKLPETGFVAQVDGNGMATVATGTERAFFGGDYFWSKTEGAYGVLRGGFYDSGTDAGFYTVHADTPPNTSGTGIGFRCVR